MATVQERKVLCPKFSLECVLEALFARLLVYVGGDVSGVVQVVEADVRVVHGEAVGSTASVSAEVESRHSMMLMRAPRMPTCQWLDVRWILN